MKVSSVADDASANLFDGGESQEMSLDDLFGTKAGDETGLAASPVDVEPQDAGEESGGESQSEVASPEEPLEATPGAHIQLAGCENVHIHVNSPASGEQNQATADDGKAASVPELTPEQKFERDVAYAKERFTSASMYVSELESQVKAFKSDLKDARISMEEAYDTLITLQERGPEQPKPVPTAASQQATDSGSPQTDPSSPSPSPTANEPAEDNAWRAEPLTVLELDKIDGLGKKKLDALMEAVPTIGAFEDLRAQAGAMGVHTLLPKGLGRKIADELEDRQIEWLKRRWAKAAAQQPAEPMSVDHAAVFGDQQVEEPDAPEVDNDDHDIDEGNPVGQSENLPFGLPPRTEVDGEDEETQIRRRLNELASATTNPSAPDIDIYREGRGAAGAGLYVTECDYDPGEDQDSWLLGFLAGGE